MFGIFLDEILEGGSGFGEFASAHEEGSGLVGGVLPDILGPRGFRQFFHGGDGFISASDLEEGKGLIFPGAFDGFRWNFEFSFFGPRNKIIVALDRIVRFIHGEVGPSDHAGDLGCDAAFRKILQAFVERFEGFLETALLELGHADAELDGFGDGIVRELAAEFGEGFVGFIGFSLEGERDDDLHFDGLLLFFFGEGLGVAEHDAGLIEEAFGHEGIADAKESAHGEFRVGFGFVKFVAFALESARELIAGGFVGGTLNLGLKAADDFFLAGNDFVFAPDGSEGFAGFLEALFVEEKVAELEAGLVGDGEVGTFGELGVDGAGAGDDLVGFILFEFVDEGLGLFGEDVAEHVVDIGVERVIGVGGLEGFEIGLGAGKLAELDKGDGASEESFRFEAGIGKFFEELVVGFDTLFEGIIFFGGDGESAAESLVGFCEVEETIGDDIIVTLVEILIFGLAGGEEKGNGLGVFLEGVEGKSCEVASDVNGGLIGELLDELLEFLGGFLVVSGGKGFLAFFPEGVGGLGSYESWEKKACRDEEDREENGTMHV